MIFVLSPTKTMQQNIQTHTRCKAIDEQLINKLKALTVDDIQKNFKVSKKIASEVFQYYQNPKYTTAIYGFCGIQYKQLQLSNYQKNHIDYMQKHVRILSALYGVIYPLDTIQLYRLDMENQLGINLYEYWKHYINKEFKDDVIVSLASNEYAKMLMHHRVIQVQFLIFENNKYITKATYAKIARGKFIDYCIRNQITNLQQLKSIVVDDFVFDEAISTNSCYCYIKIDKN